MQQIPWKRITERIEQWEQAALIWQLPPDCLTASNEHVWAAQYWRGRLSALQSAARICTGADDKPMIGPFTIIWDLGNDRGRALTFEEHNCNGPLGEYHRGRAAGFFQVYRYILHLTGYLQEDPDEAVDTIAAAYMTEAQLDRLRGWQDEACKILAVKAYYADPFEPHCDICAKQRIILGHPAPLTAWQLRNAYWPHHAARLLDLIATATATEDETHENRTA